MADVEISTVEKKKLEKKKSVKGGVSRFEGEGVQFKAKFIGVEPVSNYSGDEICRDSMARLKAQVLARKEHKQRIWINLRLDGVRISGQEADVGTLYDFPIVRISFVWRDPTDARAFGLICRDPDSEAGSTDGEKAGEHKFYAIKPEKAANTILFELKDLFKYKHEQKLQEVEMQKKIVEEEKAIIPAKAVEEICTFENDNDANIDGDISSRLRAPSKAQCDLLNMESELETLNVTFSQIETVSSRPSLVMESAGVRVTGYEDFRDIFASASEPTQQLDNTGGIWGDLNKLQTFSGQVTQTSIGQEFGNLVTEAPQFTIFAQQQTIQSFPFVQQQNNQGSLFSQQQTSQNSLFSMPQTSSQFTQQTNTGSLFSQIQPNPSSLFAQQQTNSSSPFLQQQTESSPLLNQQTNQGLLFSQQQNNPRILFSQEQTNTSLLFSQQQTNLNSLFLQQPTNPSSEFSQPQTNPSSPFSQPQTNPSSPFSQQHTNSSSQFLQQQTNPTSPFSQPQTNPSSPFSQQQTNPTLPFSQPQTNPSSPFSQQLINPNSPFLQPHSNPSSSFSQLQSSPFLQSEANTGSLFSQQQPSPSLPFSLSTNSSSLFSQQTNTDSPFAQQQNNLSASFSQQQNYPGSTFPQHINPNSPFSQQQTNSSSSFSQQQTNPSSSLSQQQTNPDSPFSQQNNPISSFSQQQTTLSSSFNLQQTNMGLPFLHPQTNINTSSVQLASHNNSLYQQSTPVTQQMLSSTLPQPPSLANHQIGLLETQAGQLQSESGFFVRQETVTGSHGYDGMSNAAPTPALTHNYGASFGATQSDYSITGFNPFASVTANNHVQTDTLRESGQAPTQHKLEPTLFSDLFTGLSSFDKSHNKQEMAPLMLGATPNFSTLNSGSQNIANFSGDIMAAFDTKFPADPFA